VRAAALALAAIRFYQRFISPYKGFSCALRVATGGASCSAYGHAVIARFGLLRGFGLLQRRFALCGHVHGRLRAVAPVQPRLKYQRGFCDVPACDGPCDLPCHGHGGGCVSADTAFDLLGCACDAGDCGSSGNRGRRAARSRSSAELDAVAERIRRQRARRSAPDPATRATESSPAAED
jgi:putative component of membrane protein insertase Oxa1/YidC/SpoIIIJ protein YidD